MIVGNKRREKNPPPVVVPAVRAGARGADRICTQAPTLGPGDAVTSARMPGPEVVGPAVCAVGTRQHREVAGQPKGVVASTGGSIGKLPETDILVGGAV